VADFDITALVLAEHEAFRRAFAEIDGLRDDPEQAGRRWRELADQLEVHAAGEEAVLYPALLRDVDGSEGDTEHAVHDHNEIREATRAVDEHEVGSDGWWEALAAARETTADHLAEEENDVLPPFAEQVSGEQRNALGMRWLRFLEEHEGAKGLSAEPTDPGEYVEEHTA
jgi:hemerythrin-like domain-containing protein